MYPCWVGIIALVVVCALVLKFWDTLVNYLVWRCPDGYYGLSDMYREEARKRIAKRERADG